MTVHKSQGQGKREVFHLMNLGMMDNASALVAFIRLTKGSYKLYGTYEDVERLHERLGLEHLKATVLDAGIKQQQAATSKAQRSRAQAEALQSKLDALFHEHKEGHGKIRAMRSRVHESNGRHSDAAFIPLYRAVSRVKWRHCRLKSLICMAKEWTHAAKIYRPD